MGVLWHLYTAKPGEQLALLPNGATVVTHPDREPFLVLPDGMQMPISPVFTIHNEIMEDVKWIEAPSGPLTFKFSKLGNPDVW